ncbi:dihydrolipoamide acetyltransferase family protein [Streptantibioticus silvisoli]|uniref:Dihydrolipoamide acetyltransferase component of pyruvate dehydrogenase complex n=1 Tax=Streptantibioticus silvisoli TaxID=2705255 RepID=A0ABT6W0K0_9ACTN|nr:dihydrolipoamide acetyltransferase family protein [Streptantibioticus silvisoli]MDI5964274.1 dihydrolipoamide acetyltransferase family protein [Streptantibioticus silvisoli]
MPDVGEGLTEAEILKWFVAVGDTVSDGQVVCEVETAKAAVELPIPFDGVVSELRFPEGDTVDVGTAIISVDTTPGAPVEEPAPAPAPAAAPAASAPAAPAADEPAPKRQAVLVGYGVATTTSKRRPRRTAAPASAAVREQVQAELNGTAAPAATPVPTAPVPAAAPTAAPASGDRPLAKPPVRKLARDLGVDLAAVLPTGPHGDITRDDVHAAAAPEPAAPQAAPAPAARVEQPTAPAAGAGADVSRETRVPIKGVRKATAQAMVASAFTAPHVTEFVTFDITRSMRLVQELKLDPAFAGLKVSPLLLVAKALLVAIRRNPDVNAAWDEVNQEIVRKSYVNLGIAAATPRGLIVPNIKDANALTLPQLAAALGDLVGTAREGRTTPAAMQGGTVTITNVGVFGVDTGTPILNPGESAILAFGAVKDQPWVHKGKVKPRKVTTLALSFDHRLVDGELGSKVLGDIAAVLEQPKRLMTWA